MSIRAFDVNQLATAPDDREEKEALHRELMRLTPSQLRAKLNRQIQEVRPTRMSSDILSGHTGQEIQRVLDSTGGTTGNVLPRVDIEQTIWALFVKMFPYWDRIQKGPSNGLVHTWNAMTFAGSATDTQLAIATELTAVTDDTGTYKQFNNANIATIDTQRGVSLKEIAAVRQSGMSYSPEEQELYGGTIMMKRLIQKFLFQGNFSVASGTATNEKGAYSANYFDGLRLITSGIAPYNSPGAAIAIDADGSLDGGPFSLTQAINDACAGQIDQGGNPSLIVASAKAKARLMNEQEGKQRTERSDLVPGVMVNSVETINGDLPVLMVPGAANALGTYLRTSDGASVQDIYVVDESSIWLRWIGSPDINVLEIPVGVDGKLSRRFILFMFVGLQVADNGYFQSKVRMLN